MIAFAGAFRWRSVGLHLRASEFKVVFEPLRAGNAPKERNLGKLFIAQSHCLV